MFPRSEQRLHRAMRAAYGLGDDADLAAVADGWRPLRSWVALLLRGWLEEETGDIARGRRGDTPLPRLAD